MVYRIEAYFEESRVTFFENIQGCRCFNKTAYVFPRIDVFWEEATPEFKGTGTRAVFSTSL